MRNNRTVPAVWEVHNKSNRTVPVVWEVNNGSKRTVPAAWQWHFITAVCNRSSRTVPVLWQSIILYHSGVQQDQVNSTCSLALSVSSFSSTWDRLLALSDLSCVSRSSVTRSRCSSDNTCPQIQNSMLACCTYSKGLEGLGSTVLITIK